MKHHQKTLVELLHLAHLSKVGATASCSAAKIHETKEFAKRDVAEHRALSRDIRNSIGEFLRQLDRYDADVEGEFQKVVAMKFRPADDCESIGDGSEPQGPMP